MSVTLAQAQQALRQVMADLNRSAAAVAAAMGVDSVTAAAVEPPELQPYWTATTRKGTTVHRAGPGGFTVDPCRRSMLAGGVRLTRAEADAIPGRTWCPRCGGDPDA